jgi:hypothetical protein
MIAFTARSFGIVTILALAGLPLCADTLYSTFSSSNPSYDPNTGDAWADGGTTNTSLGVGFQSPFSTPYLLSQIQVADGFSVSDPNSTGNPALNNLNVAIWQNTTNNINTATLLQSWAITAPGSTGQPQIYTLNSAVSTIINPADFYFITETVTVDGTNTAEWGWQENNLTPFQIGYYSGFNGTPGSFTFENNPCTNSPCNAANDPGASGTPAVSITGTAISSAPEPDTAAILGLALAALLLKVRLKRPSQA